MARCEDFPCCGHELGCCPDFDDSGQQLNIKCTCGATVPLNSRSSICAGCLRDPDDPHEWDRQAAQDEADEDADEDADNEKFPSEYDLS